MITKLFGTPIFFIKTIVFFCFLPIEGQSLTPFWKTSCFRFDYFLGSALCSSLKTGSLVRKD